MSGLDVSRLVAEAKQAAKSGRLGEARAACERAVKRDKRNLEALELLGVLALEQGLLDEAAKRFAKCAALKPSEPRYRLRAGQVLHEQGRIDEALGQFDKALRNGPDAATLIAKAAALERVGRRDEARATLDEVGGDAATRPAAVTLLARLDVAAGEPGRAVDRLRARLDAAPLAARDRRGLLFALGRALEADGAYDDAFAACREANEIDKPAFDAAAYVAFVDRLIATFPAGDGAAALARSSDRSRLPIVVAGMPRSGTTLVEQILAAHPDVAGAGELIHLPRRVTTLQMDLDSYEPYPDCLEDMTPAAAARLGREYLAALRGGRRAAKRVVDKTLDNVELLGLIALIAPGASAVACRRDPLDTCVSCYLNELVASRFPWVTDLAALGTVYRQQERLMAHWREALDIPIHEVVYEAVTAEPEPQIRALLEAMELPWDERCQRFHESGRAVMTLSYDQVSRPMYRTSVQRWKRFERHLGPLRDALGE